MAYLIHGPNDLTPQELEVRFREYLAYLESVRNRLPRGAYEFAIAAWHYDAGDQRCPHDSWVNSLCIVVPATGEREETRSLELRLELLGSHHDGRIQITYAGVHRYSLFQPFEYTKAIPVANGHGNWLVDEITASNNGRPERPLAVQEIVFSRHGMWTIEAEDIVYEWNAKAE